MPNEKDYDVPTRILKKIFLDPALKANSPYLNDIDLEIILINSKAALDSCKTKEGKPIFSPRDRNIPGRANSIDTTDVDYAALAATDRNLVQIYAYNNAYYSPYYRKCHSLSNEGACMLVKVGLLGIKIIEQQDGVKFLINICSAEVSPVCLAQQLYVDIDPRKDTKRHSHFTGFMLGLLKTLKDTFPADEGLSVAERESLVEICGWYFGEDMGALLVQHSTVLGKKILIHTISSMRIDVTRSLQQTTADYGCSTALYEAYEQVFKQIFDPAALLVISQQAPEQQRHDLTDVFFKQPKAQLNPATFFSPLSRALLPSSAERVQEDDSDDSRACLQQS